MPWTVTSKNGSRDCAFLAFSNFFPPRDRQSFLPRTTPFFPCLTIGIRLAHNVSLFLSTPQTLLTISTQDASWPGSELSDCSSDLGGYGEPERPQNQHLDIQVVTQDTEVVVENQVEEDEEMVGDEVAYGGIRDGSQAAIWMGVGVRMNFG